MCKNGSKPLRGLTKVFEDGRKLAQLSYIAVVVCSHVHVSQSELVAEVCGFKGFLSAGEL